MKDTTMSRSEDSPFIIGSRYYILFRSFKRAHRGNPAHYIRILIFLIPSDSVQIIIYSFTFEKDRSLRVLLARSRNYLYYRIHRNHILVEFGYMPSSPKHISLSIVVNKDFSINPARILTLQ